MAKVASVVAGALAPAGTAAAAAAAAAGGTAAADAAAARAQEGALKHGSIINPIFFRSSKPALVS